MNALAAASGTSAGQTIGGIVLVLIVGVLYITPTLIASYRRAASLSPVVVVNIFLGWTVIGWIVALAMAVSGPSGRRPKPVPQWQPPNHWQRR